MLRRLESSQIAGTKKTGQVAIVEKWRAQVDDVCYAAMNHPPTYSLDEAAALLAVSTQRVRHLLLVGRLTGSHAGTNRLADRQSVDDLAAERAAHPPRPGRPRKVAEVTATPPP